MRRGWVFPFPASVLIATCTGREARHISDHLPVIADIALQSVELAGREEDEQQPTHRHHGGDDDDRPEQGSDDLQHT